MKINLRFVRNVAFVGLVGLMIVAQSRGLLAYANPFGDATGFWVQYFPCYANLTTIGTWWDQVIHCDFEDNEYPDDPISHGSSMADGLYSDCIESCDTGFRHEYVEDNYGPYPGSDPGWCLYTWEPTHGRWAWMTHGPGASATSGTLVILEDAEASAAEVTSALCRQLSGTEPGRSLSALTT